MQIEEEIEVHSTKESNKFEKRELPITLPKHLKGPDLILEDKFTVKGYKGYQTQFANHKVVEGYFFFEAEILAYDLSSNMIKGLLPKPDLRVGFSQDSLDVNMPAGSTSTSYCIRASDGAIIVDGKILKVTSPFKSWDFIGCLIKLDPPKPPFAFTKYKNIPGINMNKGGFIKFYKNGEFLYEISPLFEGAYYPTLSLFMNARCKFHSGNTIAHPVSYKEE